MATTYLQKLRRFNRDVRLLMVSNATIGFCYFGVYSVLLNLYLLRLGYGPEFIGLVNGAGLLIFAVFGLPAGALGARWGCRRTMIAGASLTVAGFTLLPLVELLPSALWAGWLLAANLLTYLGGAMWGTNRIPFLAGATTAEERDHAFSVQVAISPLAGFAGNLVGGLLPGLLAASLGLSLDGPGPYRYPLLISAVVYGLTTLPALIATREVSAGPARETTTRTGRAPYGLIAVVGLTALLRLSGQFGASLFFNVYLDAGIHAPTSLIGSLKAIAMLMAVPAALAAPLAMGRLGKPGTIVWGSLGVVLGVLPLALVPHWAPAGLGLMAVAATDQIAWAAFLIFGQEVVSPDWRALMAGASNMAWGLSSAIVAFAGGYVIAGQGYRSFFLATAGLTLMGTLLFWAYFRVPRGEFARALEAREEELPDGIA